MSTLYSIFLILVISFFIILFIMTTFERYRKSEYFDSQEMYVAETIILNAFDKYLGRSPNPLEMRRYRAFSCTVEKLVKQLQKDFPTEFQNPDAIPKAETKSEFDVMTENVGRLRDLQNKS